MHVIGAAQRVMFRVSSHLNEQSCVPPLFYDYHCHVINCFEKSWDKFAGYKVQVTPSQLLKSRERKQNPSASRCFVQVQALSCISLLVVLSYAYWHVRLPSPLKWALFKTRFGSETVKTGSETEQSVNRGIGETQKMMWSYFPCACFLRLGCFNLQLWAEMMVM